MTSSFSGYLDVKGAGIFEGDLIRELSDDKSKPFEIKFINNKFQIYIDERISYPLNIDNIIDNEFIVVGRIK